MIASGWQGRHLYFLSNELDVVTSLVGQISGFPGKEPLDSSVTVRREEENIIFNVHQKDGWIKITDESGKRGIEMADADILAIIHVLREFEVLGQSENRHANHFCKEFGVIDDD